MEQWAQKLATSVVLRPDDREILRSTCQDIYDKLWGARRGEITWEEAEIWSRGKLAMLEHDLSKRHAVRFFAGKIQHDFVNWIREVKERVVILQDDNDPPSEVEP